MASLAGTCILLSSGSLLAASFAVNSAVDAPDASPEMASVPPPERSPVCTLRAAIQEANALPGADTITIPAGSYTLAINGRGEDHAATGDLDIDDASGASLTLSGAGPGATIIDGGGIDRLLHILSDAVISDVTIRNGHGAADFGGGLYNTNSGNLMLSESRHHLSWRRCHSPRSDRSSAVSPS